jgi:hypothetical protein
MTVKQLVDSLADVVKSDPSAPVYYSLDGKLDRLSIVHLRDETELYPVEAMKRSVVLA